LLIIAIKSLLGFVGDIQSGQPIDWTFLFVFTAVTVVGILVGSALGRLFDAQKQKGAFGWFVLVMGVVILVEELILEL
jgi:uncharacterized membrane protein YfcA